MVVQGARRTQIDSTKLTTQSIRPTLCPAAPPPLPSCLTSVPTSPLIHGGSGSKTNPDRFDQANNPVDSTNIVPCCPSPSPLLPDVRSNESPNSWWFREQDEPRSI